MAEQIPSIQDLAKTISADIASKLKLPSSQAIDKLLLKEIQNLVASNKILSKALETPDKPDNKSPEKSNKNDQVKTSVQQPVSKSPDAVSSLLKSLTDKSKEPKDSKFPDVFSSNIKSLFNKAKEPTEEKKQPEAPKSELEAIEKPKEVKIVGFEESALKSLKLPDIIGGPFEKLSKILTGGFDGLTKGLKDGKDEEDGGLLKYIPKSAMLALGGIGVLFAGITALVEAFNTEGPEKGGLMTLGKLGVKGGLAVMAKTIFKSVEIGMLKKIPIVGSLISFGEAWQRWPKDKPGALIALASGLVGLLDFAVPGLGTILSTGIDIFGAVLDAEAGGSGKGATETKMGILSKWSEALGKKLDENIKYVPVLGPMYEAGKAFLAGNITEGVKQLIYMFAPFQWLGMLLGESKSTALVASGMEATGDVLASIGKWIDEKFGDLPFIGPTIQCIKFLAKGNWKDGLGLIPGGKAVYDFLESKAPAVNAAASDAKSVFEGIGKWFTENVKDLPFIGSALRSIDLFKDHKWTEGLKELAFVVPGVRAIAAYFGDEQAKEGEKKSAEALAKFDWSPIKKWFADHIATIPFVGNLIKATELFGENKWSEGLKLIPGGSLLMSLFGGEAKTDEAATDGAGILSDLGKWFKTNIENLPFIGSAIKGVKLLGESKWKEGLKELAYAVPGIRAVAAFFGDEQAKQGEKRSAEAFAAFDWSRISDFAEKYLSEAPIIGPLMKAAAFFKAGNWTEGLKQLALSVPPIDYVAALLGSNSASGTAKDAAAGTFNFAEGIYKWANEKIEANSILGPVMRGTKLLAKGSWSEGIDEISKAFSSFSWITSLLKDNPVTNAVGSAAASTFNFVEGVYNWANEKIEANSILGPIMRGTKLLIKGSWSEGINEIGKAFPSFTWITSLLKDNPVTNAIGTGITGAFNFIEGITSWIGTKIDTNSILGPLVRGAKLLAKGSWTEGMEELGNAFSPFKWIGSLFSDNPVTNSLGSIVGATMDIGAKITNFFKEMFDSILQKFLNILPESVGVGPDSFGIKFNVRNKVAGWLGVNNVPAPAEVAPTPSPAKPPAGKEDHWWSSSKKPDNIAPAVAGSVTSNKTKDTAPAVTFEKAEAILERIAGNTATSNQNISNLISGFNNLARALERTLGESAKIPTVINTITTNNGPATPTSSHYANAGNNDISNFRSFVEGARFNSR